MAAVHLIYYLRPECGPLRHFPVHLNREIHLLSQDLDGHDSTSGSESFLGHLSYGPGNHHQHDGICLRAFLGRSVVESNLGYLVDRCGGQRGMLLFSAFYSVCLAMLSSNLALH